MSGPQAIAQELNVITIGHHMLAGLPNSCVDAVGRLLRYEELEFRTADGHVSHSMVGKNAYIVDGDGRVMVPVGSLPRIIHALQDLGLAFQIYDLRDLDRERLEVSSEGFPDGEKVFPGIRLCLSRHTEGILAIPHGRRRFEAIGVMCRLFPKARFLVACATRRASQEGEAVLGQFVGANVDAVSGRNWQSSCRVVCATFSAFDSSDPADWDVLVFEDGFDALARATHENRGGFGRHHVYSFIEPNRSLTGKQRIDLEVLAGPIIYRYVSGKHRPEVVLETAFAVAPEGSYHSPPNPRERCEQLWSACRRNRTIAAVAEACASSNPHSLWGCGLLLNEQNPFRLWDHTPIVTVLVESARHADLLARLLPEWRVMSRRPQDASSLPSLWDWSEYSVPTRSIMTAVRAEAYNRFDADIIVMASGGSTPFLPRGLARRSGHVLVIDFDDRSKPSLVRDTESRRRHYRALSQSEIAP